MRGIFSDANELTNKLFYEKKGQIIVSAIFGFAIALMFQRVCKDKKCIVIKAPDMKNMTSNTYKFEGKCYKYNTISVSCPNDTDNVISS